MPVPNAGGRDGDDDRRNRVGRHADSSGDAAYGESNTRSGGARRPDRRVHPLTQLGGRLRNVHSAQRAIDARHGDPDGTPSRSAPSSSRRHRRRGKPAVACGDMCAFRRKPLSIDPDDRVGVGHRTCSTGGGTNVCGSSSTGGGVPGAPSARAATSAGRARSPRRNRSSIA